MDNIKDLVAIILCILTAYFVANAATVEGAVLYGMPAILLCAAVSFIVHWIVAIPSLVTSSEKYFDFTGMIATLLLVATSIFALLGQGMQVSMRSTIVAIFVSIWTLRLGTFLYIRIVKSGEDKRFREIKKSLPKFLMTWTLSALWVFLTTANAVTIIVLNQHAALDLFFIAGFSLWVLGFAFEAVADKQKKSFSEIPENKDKFITLGLWSISRHPNYFGEIVLWTGIAIISLPLLSGWQFLTLVSPVFVYLLLTKISGLPFLEEKAEKKWGNDKEYLEYKNNTPILIPYFGKK
jgi:steroid 5-alpha reductase family enzyme|tara:strand:+ start:798 stop:1679 length:882 start_codon:yes stop_codon:yes gene_type:complete